jgi:polyisoprenoid-binding protein YceI
MALVGCADAGAGWPVGGGSWPAGRVSASQPSGIHIPSVDRSEATMAEGIAASESALTAIDRSHLSPIGSWTIDPADSSVSLTWSRFRLATITGRLPCLGVIHLDDLPSVGVIQFEQPSGLPVLTIALDPASIQTHDADLDARLRSPDVLDLLQHRWWTLRSESLEILPTGAWRVMATVTANGNPALLELRLEVDSAASSADWLVLQGRGLLDRRAFRMGGPGSTFSPQVRLDLAVRARRVGGPHPHSEEQVSPCTTSMPG